MWKEFKEFINKGNVVDLAVAVIMGGAFGAIVSSLVNDIIMPIVGVLLGGRDFTAFSFTVGESTILYGNFIQATVNFIVIALSVFLVMRGYNRLQKKEAEAPAPPPEPSVEERLLTEIRDILKTGSPQAEA